MSSLCNYLIIVINSNWNYSNLFTDIPICKRSAISAAKIHSSSDNVSRETHSISRQKHMNM